MPILRSLLFVPGNTPRMLDRALGLRPDAFIPDMEDSVPWDEKGNARAVTASYLPKAAETGVPVIPRVNSLDTGLLEDDLEAVIQGLPPRRLQMAEPELSMRYASASAEARK